VENSDTRRNHSDLLKIKIDLASPYLHEQSRLFWQHPRFESVFELHLKKLYHCVSSSVPLMEEALRHANQLSDNCRVANLLIPYLEKHIEEETNHDLWLLEDIESLGIRKDLVTAMITPPDVAVLIGSQYYYCSRTHPVALLSYFALVEGYPPKKEFLDEIVENTSIPREALRSFYEHAEMDIHHSEELWSLIESLPLTPGHVELLGINALLCIDKLSEILENSRRHFENE